MTLVQIPTEQTTAATDLLIAVLGIIALQLLRSGGPRGLRGQLWRGVIGLLAVTALLGAIAHGLVLSEALFAFTWNATYLGLSLLVAAFLLAAWRDLAGDAPARRGLPVVAIVALCAWGYFLIDPDNFLPFVIYEATAMLLALAGYLWLTRQGTLRGAGWIAASIAVNMVAAAIQASGAVSFTLIWPFDHNGVFHLVQILGLALLVHGLRVRA